MRNGKEKTVKAVLESARKQLDAGQRAVHPLLDGVGLKNADDNKGVVVTEVQPGSPAAGKLQPGDLLVSVNQRRIRSVSELQAVAGGNGNGLLLRVIRGRFASWVVLKKS